VSRPAPRAWIAAPALVAAFPAIAIAIGACGRHADIRDEPDGAFTPPPTLDAGDIPELDSGLSSDAFAPCADRDPGGCEGPIDFPCAFAAWVQATAQSCQTSTGCKTNGWLEVHMGQAGCVTAIDMDQPNPEVVACLVEAFGSAQCPCTEAEASFFFGNDNVGTCP
jgi:hypothetical protein